MTIPTTTSAFAAPAVEPPLIVRGDARFWRVSFAPFIGGFATFALLYCVQPASSWVGLRANAARAQASALYLFFYYLGSSVAGAGGGWVFAGAGWPGVSAVIGALSGLALAVALRLSRVPPPAHLRTS